MRTTSHHLPFFLVARGGSAEPLGLRKASRKKPHFCIIILHCFHSLDRVDLRLKIGQCLFLLIIKFFVFFPRLCELISQSLVGLNRLLEIVLHLIYLRLWFVLALEFEYLFLIDLSLESQLLDLVFKHGDLFSQFSWSEVIFSHGLDFVIIHHHHFVLVRLKGFQILEFSFHGMVF